MPGILENAGGRREEGKGKHACWMEPDAQKLEKPKVHRSVFADGDTIRYSPQVSFTREKQKR